jgi:tight adherence protein B
MTVLMIVGLFFIAAVLGLMTLYMSYATISKSPAHELRRRLRKMALETEEEFPADLRLEILVEMSPIDKFLYKFKQIRKLDSFIDRAGLKVDVKMFSLIMLVSGLNGFFIGAAMKRGIVPAVVLMIIGGYIPLYYLLVKKNKRVLQFTEQFPNALDMISRSLKAGHSFVGAIQMVGNEMSDPIRGLFKTVYEEQSLGLSMQDAFSHMTERIESEDLGFFFTAINLYKDIGGNLSEILDNLARTIRERIKVRKQVRVFTVQGRVSSYILGIAPIAIALLFYFVAPGYIEELFNTKVGRYAMVFAIISQIVGYLIIRRIVDVKI